MNAQRCNVNLSMEYNVTNDSYIGYKQNRNICNIPEHSNMIHIEDYNLCVFYQ